MSRTDARNAAAEAQGLIGSSATARVLEPSPPAVLDQDWFADDPVAIDGDGALVLPASMALSSGGHTDWNKWLAAHPEHREWAAQRWLGGPRSLGAPPPSLPETRIALHRLAAYVIAPTRHAANGKFGLRWTLGGFGTPFFSDAGQDRQVRVVGTELVDQRGDTARTLPITTLAAAVDFLGTAISAEAGAESDSPAVGDLELDLAIDPSAADFLGNWFGMGFAALERVRADPLSVAPSRPQLWPGHFDPAIEVGDDDHRGSYGASPGDPAIPEPYLYVSVWWPDRLKLDTQDPVWNAPSFTGAILKLADFGPGDPVDVAADFWTSIRDRIQS